MPETEPTNKDPEEKVRPEQPVVTSEASTGAEEEVSAETRRSLARLIFGGFVRTGRVERPYR